MQCTVFLWFTFCLQEWKVLVSLSLPYQEWLGCCFRAKHIVSIGKYFCWQIMAKISTHPTVSYSTFINILFSICLFHCLCMHVFFVQMRVVKKKQITLIRATVSLIIVHWFASKIWISIPVTLWQLGGICRQILS